MSPANLTEEQLRTAALALDPERIVETIATLRRRIDERFPGSGLGRVCATLLDIGQRTRERIDWVQRPNLWLRTGSWLMALLLAAGAVAAGWAVVVAAFVAGLFGVTNPIVQNIWMPALAGAIGLVANYHWAATRDDGNRMQALKDLFLGLKG